MGVQDERRELAQIELFNLIKPTDEGRSGIDAILRLGDIDIPFELKSTTDGSVTTARDFGADHIAKWRNKHFLISKYSKSGAAIEYTIYGGPLDMEPWLKSKEDYIRPDNLISSIAPSKLTHDNLILILGEKESYTYKDALSIQKRQYSKDKYIELMDVTDGYSPSRMLQILQDRCKYLLERGATLNNPHISKNYFKDWSKITQDHAENLKKLVELYLAKH